MSEVQNTNGIPSLGFINELLSGKAEKSFSSNIFNGELSLALDLNGLNKSDAECKTCEKAGFDFSYDESELPEIPGFIDLNVIGLNPEVSELSQNDIDNLLSKFNHNAENTSINNHQTSTKSTQLNNFIPQVDYNSPVGIILNNSDFNLLTKIQSQFETSNFNKSNIEDSQTSGIFAFNSNDFNFDDFEIPDEIKHEMKKFELKNNQLNNDNDNDTNTINTSSKTEFSSGFSKLDAEIDFDNNQIITNHVNKDEEVVPANNNSTKIITPLINGNSKDIVIEYPKVEINANKENRNIFVQGNTDTEIEPNNINVEKNTTPSINSNSKDIGIEFPKVEINAKEENSNVFVQGNTDTEIEPNNINVGKNITPSINGNSKDIGIEYPKVEINAKEENSNVFVQGNTDTEIEPNNINVGKNITPSINGNSKDIVIEFPNVEINSNIDNSKIELNPEKKYVNIQNDKIESIFEFNNQIESKVNNSKNESNVSIFDFNNSDNVIFDYEINKPIKFKAGDADRTILKNELLNMQNISQNTNFADRVVSHNANPVEIELNNKENIEKNVIGNESNHEFDGQSLNSNNFSSNNSNQNNTFEQFQNENKPFLANLNKKPTTKDGENSTTVHNEPEIIEVQNVKTEINGTIQSQISKITTNPKGISKSTEVAEFPLVKQIVPEDFPRTSIQLIKSLPENGSGSAKLILQPQALGTVIVEINMSQNILRMEVKAETQEAVKMIENQLATLKDKLAGNGIITEKIDVSLNQENLQNFGNAGQFNRQSKREDKTARNAFIQSLNGIGTITQDAETSSIKRNFSKQGSLIETYI